MCRYVFNIRKKDGCQGLSHTRLNILIQLLSMQAQKQFQTATLLFYQNKLEQALLAIDRTLEIKPNNSVAYSNRAIILQHMERPAQAKEDLLTALSLNPLNYAAYFNLASLCLRAEDSSSFLKNIQCGIAALRLIWGRKRGSKEEVAASLQACNNNYDALVLLVLMEIGEDKYKEAADIVEKYAKCQEDRVMANRLRQATRKLADNYSVEDQEELYDLLQLQAKRGRLICSNGVEKDLLQEEVQAKVTHKLKQFNSYYKLVTDSICKSQHVPKTSQEPLPLLDSFPPRPQAFSFQARLIPSH